MFPVIALTKAKTLTALHLQAEWGRVSYEAPVAAYRPEFAVGGKGAVAAGDVLVHRPGFVAPELSPDQVGDWDLVTQSLAAAPLVEQPGIVSIYSGYVQAFVLAEVVRRTDPEHRMFGTFVQDELCRPLEIEDLWLGLPPTEGARVAVLVSDESLALGQPFRTNLPSKAVPSAIFPAALLCNRPDIHRACLPRSGGIMWARAGARCLGLRASGGTFDGTRLRSLDRILNCTTPRPNPTEVSAGNSAITWIGTGGYWIGGHDRFSDPLFGRGRHTLGVGGQWRTSADDDRAPRIYLSSGGGTVGLADLDSRLAVVICHNRMTGAIDIEDHPFMPVADAVRTQPAA